MGNVICKGSYIIGCYIVIGLLSHSNELRNNLRGSGQVKIMKFSIFLFFYIHILQNFPFAMIYNTYKLLAYTLFIYLFEQNTAWA